MLNYSCAVLNAKIVGDDRIYFVPIRVCIGKYDKKIIYFMIICLILLYQIFPTVLI